MNRLVFSFLFAASASSVVAAPPHHQEPRNSSEIKEAAHETLTDNAPDGWPSQVPHFALFGKKDVYYLGIGGSAKVTLGEDWGAPLSNPNEFTTSNIAPATPGSKSKFQLSAQQSSLYFNFIALPKSDNKIGVFVGMNFLNNYVPVLQSAYVKWRGLKAGYDYSSFSDNASLPPTIDFEGPNAATSITVPTVTYTYNFGKKKNWSASIGVELPQLYITTNNSTSEVTQSVPDIPASIKYAWDASGTDYLKFSAILRNMTYRNDHADKNVDVVGWGIQLSGTSDIVGNLRGYWTAVYGNGIDSYIQDLNGLNMDLVPRGNQRALKANKTWGAFGGLQYSFTPKVYASATYSHVRNYADRWSDNISSTSWGNQYKYAQYAVANLFWEINPIVTSAIEYIYGRRVNNDNSQAHTNRLQTMIQVNF